MHGDDFRVVTGKLDGELSRADFWGITGESDGELLRADFRGVTGESEVELMLSRNQLKVGRSFAETTTEAKLVQKFWLEREEEVFLRGQR